MTTMFGRRLTPQCDRTPRNVARGALVLSAVVFCLGAIPQTSSKPPLPKADVLRLLKGAVSPHRLATLASEHGIDFQVTSQVDEEVRQGVGDEALLAVLREIAPKPIAPPVPKSEINSTTPKPSAAPPSTLALAPGTVRTNLKDGLKYVWIPPGTFMMGCSPGDNDCQIDEKPPHQVTMTKGFWMGQTEVTVEAYRRYVNVTVTPINMPGGQREGQDPVVNVTWNEAAAYCQWAGGRLPTEAEWEYAARGGSTQARYGDINDVAWYGANSGRHAHQVAQKRANGFGLCDTLGNVWEWVNDWYDEKYYQNTPSPNPSGPGSGQLRVLRGGSCYDVPGHVRVSNRGRLNPRLRVDGIGLRCAREAVNP
jgi:formylglycine-generating enzyme required for sulfatase activity